MDTKKFLFGTLAGGIAFFLLGYLFYGLVLMNFYSAHAGSATGVSKSMEEMGWGALILGNFAFGALLTYIFLKWANITTFVSGASGGSVIGLLMGLSYNLTSFGTTNIMDLTAALTDVVVSCLMTAIVGGIVGLVLGMGGKQ